LSPAETTTPPAARAEGASWWRARRSARAARRPRARARTRRLRADVGERLLDQLLLLERVRLVRAGRRARRLRSRHAAQRQAVLEHRGEPRVQEVPGAAVERLLLDP